MNNSLRRLALARPLAVILLICGGLAAVAWGTVFPQRATAQGVDVQITELDCNSDPEMLTVENKGATPVDMTGWNLQSDPTSSESLALQSFGSLASGASLTVQSGPKAQGIVWSQTEKFRNNDANDFAQLASDEGFVLVKVNCTANAQQTAAAQPTAAPTAAASVAPSPAATALAAASAPQGGGPPPEATAIPPAALIALGSGLLTAGLGTFALPFGGRRRRLESTPSAESQGSLARVLPAGPVLQRTRYAKPPGITESVSPYVLLIAIGAVVLGTLLLLLQFGGHKQK